MTRQYSAEPTTEPLQRAVKIRRDYNTWVANEMLEDYTLRFTLITARSAPPRASSSPPKRKTGQTTKPTMTKVL